MYSEAGTILKNDFPWVPNSLHFVDKPPLPPFFPLYLFLLCFKITTYLHPSNSSSALDTTSAPIPRDSITLFLLEASSLGTLYCLQRACFAPYQNMSDLSNDFFEKKETSSLPPLSRMLMSNDAAVGQLATLQGRRAGAAYGMVAKGIDYILEATLALLHGMIFFYSFWTSYTKGHLTFAGSTFGVTLPIANAAALVLYFDLAVLVLPVCQTMSSILKKSPLGCSIHYDTNMLHHKMVGWYIVFFALVHTIGHLINFAFLAVKDDMGFKGFLILNLGSIPGWSGYVMVMILGLIAATSLKRFRLANFGRFYYTHHLFVVFFIFLSVHGICCMVKKDEGQNHAGMCGVRYSSIWQWLIYGGLGYLLGERSRKEFAGRYKTHISKVIRHPGDVVEIQVKKEKTRMRIGQVSIQRSFSIFRPDVGHSTSISAAPKSPSGNTVASCLLALPRKISCPFICIALATSPAQ